MKAWGGGGRMRGRRSTLFDTLHFFPPSPPRHFLCGPCPLISPSGSVCRGLCAVTRFYFFAWFDFFELLPRLRCRQPPPLCPARHAPKIFTVAMRAALEALLMFCLRDKVDFFRLSFFCNCFYCFVCVRMCVTRRKKKN